MNKNLRRNKNFMVNFPLKICQKINIFRFKYFANNASWLRFSTLFIFVLISKKFSNMLHKILLALERKYA